MNNKVNVSLSKKRNYLDTVSSGLVSRKVISYKIKAYHEIDGSISFGVTA